MKKHIRSLIPHCHSLMLMAAIALTLGACNSDEQARPVIDPHDQPIATEKVAYTSWGQFIADAMASHSAQEFATQPLAQRLLTTMHTSIDQGNQELARQMGIAQAADLSGYCTTMLAYPSVSDQGQRIWLTMRIIYPAMRQQGTTQVKPIQPRAVVAACHHTICSNAEAPWHFAGGAHLATATGLSATYAAPATASSFQALVVVPDYQGYGPATPPQSISPDQWTTTHRHPYMQNRLAARQIVDAMRYARWWYARNVMELPSHIPTVSVGYSQGGSASFAVNRHLTRENLLQEFNFQGSVSGGGVYDLATAVPAMIERGAYPMSAFIAMIFDSFTTSPIGGRYTYEDYLNPAFCNTDIRQLLGTKAYTSSQLQQILVYHAITHGGLSVGHTPAMPVPAGWQDVDLAQYSPLPWTDVLRSEVVDYLLGRAVAPEHEEKCQLLKKAFEDDGLDYGWRATAIAILEHSQCDNYCPVESAQAVDTYVQGCVLHTYDFEGIHDHISFGLYFQLPYLGLAWQDIRALLSDYM